MKDLLPLILTGLVLALFIVVLWLKKPKGQLREKAKEVSEDQRNIIRKTAHQELLITQIADALKQRVHDDTAKPDKYEDFMKKYLTTAGCGEHVYQAQSEYVRAHPIEALAWFEANVMTLNPEARELLSDLGAFEG